MNNHTWKKWFAWYPVFTNHRFYWLTFVLRKRVLVFTKEYVWIDERKPIELQLVTYKWDYLPYP